MVPLPYDEQTFFQAISAGLLFFAAAMFVLNLILCLVLAHAARSRGRSGFLWFLFGLVFSGPIGALFLIAHGDALPSQRSALSR